MKNSKVLGNIKAEALSSTYTYPSDTGLRAIVGRKKGKGLAKKWSRCRSAINSRLLARFSVFTSDRTRSTVRQNEIPGSTVRQNKILNLTEVP